MTTQRRQQHNHNKLNARSRQRNPLRTNDELRALKETLSLVGKAKKVAEGLTGSKPSQGFSEPASALGKEFVLFNHRGHCHLAFGGAVLDPHHASFALHADALGQCDFGRKCEGEADWRPLLDGGIQVKTKCRARSHRGFQRIRCSFYLHRGQRIPESGARSVVQPFSLPGLLP